MSNIGQVTGAGNIPETIAADKTLKGNKAASYFNNGLSSLKEDTLSLSNKTSKKGINKKGLIIGAIAVTGIAAGIIYAVKTGKLKSITTDIEGYKSYKSAKKAAEEAQKAAEKEIQQAREEILKESEGIIEEGKKVYDEALETIDEVKDLIVKGKENGFREVKDENGNVIRRFVDDSLGWNDITRYDPFNGCTERLTTFNTAMEEFDNAGNLLRETIFDKDNLDNLIIKTIDPASGKLNETKVLDGVFTTALKPRKYESGYYGYPAAEKVFRFGIKNGNLFNYYEGNCKEVIDGAWSTDRAFDFSKNKLRFYFEDYCTPPLIAPYGKSYEF